MKNIITIKTAELAVGHNDDIIKTGSVGSCVVIAIYDKETKIGGLAHSMLPERREGHPMQMVIWRNIQMNLLIFW